MRRSWCKDNSILLTATKSQISNFSLQKKIDSAPIRVNDTEIEDLSAVKLLGVKFYSHMKFTNHVESMIDKAKPVVQAIIQLKRLVLHPSVCAGFISHVYYRS